MRVVGTFHPSSSVSRSLKCCLTTDTSVEYLVIAKTDKLEIHSLCPEGLKQQCTVDMWGRVVGLQAIPGEVSTSPNTYADASVIVGYRIQSGHLSSS